MKVNRTALRTIEILEYISRKKSGCTLLEIAEAMEIPKSSAFDIMKTLLYKKMIVEDQSHGKLKYRMGINSFVIGSSCLDGFDLIEASKPKLIHLAKQFHCTVFLAMLDENMVTYLYKYESQESAITTANIGTRKSVHCTGLGKVLLAFQRNQNKVEDMIHNVSFEPRTEYTITTSSAYLKELALVKQRGYAIDDREDTLYQICVAAPIFNHNKNVIAAISCVFLYEENMKIDDIGKTAQNVAFDISKELGYCED